MIRSTVGARNWRLVDLFELGDGPSVEAELDAYAALATQARLPSLSWYVPMWRASLATLAQRPEEGRELAQRARDLGGRVGDANAEVFFQANRHMSWLADERFEEWTPQMLAFSEQRTKRSQAGLAYLAGIASVFAATGRLDAARSALDTVAADDFATVPHDMNWLSTMASATEVCAHLGDTAGEHAQVTARALRRPDGDRRPRRVPSRLGRLLPRPSRGHPRRPPSRRRAIRRRRPTRRPRRRGSLGRARPTAPR